MSDPSDWTITMGATWARVKYRRVTGVVKVKAAGAGFVLEAIEHPKVLARGDLTMEPQSLSTAAFATLAEGIEEAKQWLLSYDAEAWLAAEES